MICPRLARGPASAIFGLLLPAANAAAQETTRVSVSSSGQQSSDNSTDMRLSADGRLVVFASYASNLVAGDVNGAEDVFLHDLATGITELVSVDGAGGQGDNGSALPTISADGQFVAFTSWASNLVPGDTNGSADVFVRDRSTGAIERVSVDSSGNQGDGTCLWPSLSSDGRFVAFESGATNLVAGDTNGFWDIFVHDRASGVTERVSVSTSGAEANDHSNDASISADGSLVAFDGVASNLVPGDTNAVADIFVRDRTTGVTERVSVDSSGLESDGFSDEPTISADGQLVAYASGATNLVAGDTNKAEDIFVHDRTTSLVERVSVDSSGAEADDFSYGASISADGRTVVFISEASNLVPADTNGVRDVFLHDRGTGGTERRSVDSSGNQGNLSSGANRPASSSDGWTVAFASNATNLVPGDTNHFTDTFVHERCSIAASWSNYGAGFPGSFGIPALTSRQNPVHGTTITLDLDNSLQAPTTGLLFLGYQRSLVPTNRGGDLLVDPVQIVPITFSYGGDSFSGFIPDDLSLCGFAYDLQAVEADPGAAQGFSFTPGLELVVGV